MLKWLNTVEMQRISENNSDTQTDSRPVPGDEGVDRAESVFPQKKYI